MYIAVLQITLNTQKMKATNPSNFIKASEKTIDILQEANSILTKIAELKKLVRNKHCVCPWNVESYISSLGQLEGEVIVNTTEHTENN